MATASARPNIFVLDGSIFSSPNASTMPPIPSQPPVDYQELEQYGDPSLARATQWSMNAFPHLAFAPASVVYRGTIFGRLAYNKDTVPLERDGNLWRLAKPVADKWRRLEQGLHYVAHTLIFNSDYALPLDFIHFPLPSTKGYLRSHRQHKAALRCAIMSRDAFVPLMAMCSMGLALSSGTSTIDIAPDLTPSWMRCIKQFNEMHDEWLELLRSSCVGEFSDDNPRLGVIIDLTSCQYLNLIPVFLRWNIPVWYYWGQLGSKLFVSDRKLVDACCPTKDEIYASMATQGGPSGPVLSPSKSLEIRFPKPEAKSRQKVGETWQRFFAREGAKLTERAACASDKDRQRRLNRERAAQSSGPPGRSGPVVYVWIENDGFLIRTKINRGDVDNWWYKFSATQRRFNAFNDEWDLCTQFDPDARAGIDVDYENDHGPDDSFGISGYPESEVAPVYNTGSRFANMPKPSPPSKSTWQEDLAQSLDSEWAEPLSTMNMTKEPLDLFMYYRFGFKWPSGMENDPYKNAAGAVLEPQAWKQTRLLLGDDSSPVAQRYQAPITDLVQTLVNKGTPASILWDLNDANPHPLAQAHHFHYVTVRKFDGVTFYSIEPYDVSQRLGWIIMTESAVAAIECLRRELLRPCDIASYFLDRGIPFTTRIVRLPDVIIPSSYPRPPLRFNIGLGWRPPKYKPDAVDYAAYRDVRDTFLRQPRGRAALLKGGIVWRLAVESLTQDTVLVGPSEDVYTNGDVRRSPDGVEFWDDELSEDELELICGVYKVYTGYGVQSADLSWWPKPSAWQKSGLNVGYWSPHCENWYQNRCQQIKNNTAELRNGTQWPGSLRLIHKQAKIAQHNEKLAANYIAEKLLKLSA